MQSNAVLAHDANKLHNGVRGDIPEYGIRGLSRKDGSERESETHQIEERERQVR